METTPTGKTKYQLSEKIAILSYQRIGFKAPSFEEGFLVE
jgi:hypothetical protein